MRYWKSCYKQGSFTLIRLFEPNIGLIEDVLVPDLELGAAAMIDPHAISIVAPAISKPAGRLADLASDANTAASIDFAVLTSAEIGRAPQTSNISRIADESGATSLEFKIGTAAMIDPNAVAIVPPAISLPAR